ncbi:MAG: hypothetical protein RR555_02120 [Bacteroidales bacterium]
MSGESQILIGKLKGHIGQIISNYESVASDNILLKEELSACKKELETSKNTIKELEKKLEQLQLIKAFGASSQDVKEAKQKIGRIVKEIDKCISMLND